MIACSSETTGGQPRSNNGMSGNEDAIIHDPSSRTRRVLIVDDQEESRQTISRVIMSLGYETEIACDGIEALAKLKLDVDLVILDATMPNLDGFEVAHRIRQDAKFLSLPIIMLTGLHSKEDRLRSIEAGVNDFISKPFEVTELKLRAELLLKLKEAHDSIKRHKEELEQTVERRTGDLRAALEETAAAERMTFEAHLDTIRRLVLAAECKDRDTAAHSERIGRYCELLAGEVSLSPGRVDIIRYASPMHDVGKIGIPDAILLKPGQLTDEEWEIMKRHAAIGARILHGSPSKVLQTGEVIALSHHEKWDGSGYPGGLREQEIPIEGRICAVADVFDAMTCNRHYRDALPAEAVYEMMRAQRGRHFDSDVLDAFLDLHNEIEAIQREYIDSGDVELASGRSW